MYLIIDCNGLCHQAKHAMKHFSFEETQTGVIFGFLRQIQKLSKLYKTNQFVFCWDSQKSLRKEIFPEYKNNRIKKEKSAEEKELDDSAYKQFHLLRQQILPMIGFKNNFMSEGYEADDLIAEVVFAYSWQKFVVVSADTDLYQLLFDNEVRIYDPKNKKEVTYKDFTEKYGITPDDWPNVKAIAGCTSDNVIGISGIAEKSAIKYLTNKLKVDSVYYGKILKGKSIIRRNDKLVRLPFEGTPPMSLTEDTLSLTAFISVCQRYGLESFISKEGLSKWKEHIFV